MHSSLETMTSHCILLKLTEFFRFRTEKNCKQLSKIEVSAKLNGNHQMTFHADCDSRTLQPLFMQWHKSNASMFCFFVFLCMSVITCVRHICYKPIRFRQRKNVVTIDIYVFLINSNENDVKKMNKTHFHMLIRSYSMFCVRCFFFLSSLSLLFQYFFSVLFLIDDCPSLFNYS